MEVLQNLPSSADYTPLAEHQAQTPASFYTGPPVLHLVARAAALRALPHDLQQVPALAKLTGFESHHLNGDAPAAALESSEEAHIAGIDIWVASDKLVLVRTAASLAIAIPYQSIALHAVAGSDLYLQLLATQPDDDDADGTIPLSLIPAPAADTDSAADAPRPIDALYQALSACADLHPDPQEQDSEDEAEPGAAAPSWMPQTANAGDELLYQVTAPAGAGQPGLPPPMPGSSGWITAENVGEYFDEEGNWKGDEAGPSLGPGAGTVRGRDAEGDGEEGGDDTKWQRTD